ncbi:alpha/beta fold hydrolase [Gemmatimonadota bacterium]
MPQIQINNAAIHYEESGTGPETIVFAHGFLWSGHMFHHQVETLKDQFRCITFDFRGQGRSEVTRSGYDIQFLTEDTATLIESLNCAPCHFVGLSMGGFVGMRLAIHHPELLKSLTLLETSADPETVHSLGQYRLLGFIARWFGLRIVANRVMPIMFGKKFLTDASRKQLKEEWRRRLISNKRLGVTRTLKGIIKRDGIHDQLKSIALPTLIVVGDQDVATPPEMAERIQAGIPASLLVTIPGAGHTSTVEEPDAVSTALRAFLEGQTG